MGLTGSQKWYAVRVRSQHEDMVARHLRVRGLESFAPLYRQQHRWSDRFKEIDSPLFPGYVFCQFSPSNRLPVLTVPGVVHIVGSGKNPVPIDDAEIAALQAAVKSGLPAQPWPFLDIGDRVRIEDGPLFGMEGILVGLRGQHRVVISITLLHRSVAVEIDRIWARPLSPSRRGFAKAGAPESAPQHCFRYHTPPFASPPTRTER